MSRKTFFRFTSLYLIFFCLITLITPGLAAVQSPPGSPTSPAASATGTSSIHLSWSQPVSWGSDGGSGPYGYNVFRSTTSGGENLAGTATATISGKTSNAFDDTGLNQGTQYFYKITAFNGNGDGSASTEVNATTQTPPHPTAVGGFSVTGDASNQTVNFTTPASPNGGPALSFYKLYKDGNFQQNFGLTPPFSMSLSLTGGTTYHFSLTAVNSAGTEGDAATTTFTPAAPATSAPTVSTPSVSAVTSSGATFTATVTSTGTLTARGICWATSPSASAPCFAEGGTATGAFTQTISSGMNPNTVIWYRGYAINSAGTGYSGFSNFTTAPASGASVPTLTSPTASSITSGGATLGANITADGGASITSRGTCWGTSSNPTTSCLAASGTATGVFTQARTGMAASTLYHYRGYATNSAGTGYSGDATFTTTAATGGGCADSTEACSFTASTDQPTSIILNWDRPTAPNLSYYVLKRGTSDANASNSSAVVNFPNQNAHNTTTFTDDGSYSFGSIVTGTTYHYKLIPHYTDIGIGTAAFASGKAGTATGVNITSPASGSTVSGTVHITATAVPAAGSDVFDVSLVVDGTDGYPSADFSPNSCSGGCSYDWNSTAVTNGSHTLKAVSRSSSGVQTFSGPITVTVSNGGGPAPATPTAPTASIGGPTEIDLTWTAVAAPVTGYKIYRNGTFLHSTTAAHDFDFSPTPGTPYTYKVSAVNGTTEGAQSPASNSVTLPLAQPPGAPSSVTVRTLGIRNNIQISWINTSNSSSTGHRIYYGHASSPATNYIVVGGRDTNSANLNYSEIHNDGDANNLYFFDITSVNDTTESPKSCSAVADVSVDGSSSQCTTTPTISDVPTNSIISGILSAFLPTGVSPSKIFVWAIGIGALLAFGVIVFGGVLWSVSLGGEQKNAAKQWIKGAIYGLLLLIASYLILLTINTNLVKL